MIAAEKWPASANTPTAAPPPLLQDRHSGMRRKRIWRLLGWHVEVSGGNGQTATGLIPKWRTASITGACALRPYSPGLDVRVDWYPCGDLGTYGAIVHDGRALSVLKSAIASASCHKATRSRLTKSAWFSSWGATASIITPMTKPIAPLSAPTR